MTVRRVLITGIGGNVGQGVLKALRAGRESYHVVGIDMEPLSAGFSLVNSYYQTPRTGDVGFHKVLARVVRDEAIEAVYVCSPSELEFFASNKDELERELSATILVNPLPVVRIGADKLRTAEFLREHGFGFPETAAASDNAGIEALIAKHGLPVIAKPRLGFSSRNVFLLDSREKIRAAAALVPDLVVQQYLPDDREEYTAATLSGTDRKVRALIVLRRDLIQGTTYRTELIRDSHLEEEVRRITETLGAVGPCNLQFRIMDGMVYVFEINARFSGTSGIRYLYGFNDCELAFQLLHMQTEIAQPTLKKAVVLRYWNEVCIPDAGFEDLREGRLNHDGYETVIREKRY